MKMAKVFKTGRSQAVRLPKEFRFDDDEVCISRLGDMVILFPRGKAWDLLESSLALFPSDFMEDREQPPAAEERDDI